MQANQVPLTPLSFLDRAADIFPSTVAVQRPDGSSIDHASLRARALRLADGLRDLGVGYGDRVAVLAPNELPLLEAHYGVPAAGAVLVALNVRLAPGEYTQILSHAACKVLIVDASLSAQVEQVRVTVDGLEAILHIGSLSSLPSWADADYETWLEARTASADSLGLPHDETDAIAVNYTSGTTGRPKGAVYTHRGAYLNALGQALQFGLSSRSTYLWTLPMFHCNGWCYTWAVTAVAGTHVCLPKFDAVEALRAIERYGVTHFCGAPVVLRELADAGRTQRLRLSHRVRAATGGAPPSPSVLADMQALGIEVLHLYGLTETYGPAMSCEPQPSWDDMDPTQLADVMSRQGERNVNVQAIRVVDALEQDVPADGRTVGEIVVRSNTVMQGYLDDPAATDRAFNGGWFHTGDLAVRHPDGYVEITDRAKDIIISGGENVSSIEIENVIAAHPAVNEVAVVAAPHPKWGEVPVAFVALRPNSSCSEDEIVRHVRDHLAGFKTPKSVHFRELPRTSTGKIRKDELRTKIVSAQEASSD